MKVVVAADAAGSIPTLEGKELDFSGRTLSYTIPPRPIWSAYYKHLYVPALRARLGASSLAGGSGGSGKRGGGNRHAGGGAAGGAGAPAGSAVRREGARGE